MVRAEEEPLSVIRIRPPEAAALLDGDPTIRYLDVRSVMEFDQGHPPRAVNIPLLDYNEDLGGMQPNERFVDVVLATFPKDTPLVVGCAAGGRSARAAIMLEQAGFTRLSDMAGGFTGQRSPIGQLVEPGWTQCGLPTSHDSADGESYASLLERTP